MNHDTLLHALADHFRHKWDFSVTYTPRSTICYASIDLRLGPRHAMLWINDDCVLKLSGYAWDIKTKQQAFDLRDPTSITRLEQALGLIPCLSPQPTTSTTISDIGG